MTYRLRHTCLEIDQISWYTSTIPVILLALFIRLPCINISTLRMENRLPWRFKNLISCISFVFTAVIWRNGNNILPRNYLQLFSAKVTRCIRQSAWGKTFCPGTKRNNSACPHITYFRVVHSVWTSKLFSLLHCSNLLCELPPLFQIEEN